MYCFFFFFFWLSTLRFSLHLAISLFILRYLPEQLGNIKENKRLKILEKKITTLLICSYLVSSTFFSFDIRSLIFENEKEKVEEKNIHVCNFLLFWPFLSQSFLISYFFYHCCMNFGLNLSWLRGKKQRIS